MDNEVNLLIPQQSDQVDLEDKKSLQDLDLSRVILIKNPNNEAAIGYCGENKLIDPLNTSASERYLTLQHYGTFVNHNPYQIRTVVTPSEYREAKIHKLLIKYVVLLLSLVLITLDVKNIRNRIATQDEIIGELRTIHIQMDDIQLYQIFWSFLIVYILSFLGFCACIILSIIHDTPNIIRNTFRLLMFILIYQFIEIILRRYDFILIFLRIVMILLIKIWLSLTIRMRVWLYYYPEFANIQFTANLFNRRVNL